MLKGLIPAKVSRNSSSGISKSGQFGASTGKLSIALKKPSRRSLPLPGSVGSRHRKPVSGGMASSGWESSMNLNKVVPDRGEPTIIGIGSSFEAAGFWVCDKPRVPRKKDRVAFVIDFVLIMAAASVNNREVPGLSEERVRGIEALAHSNQRQPVSHHGAHNMGSP